MDNNIEKICKCCSNKLEDCNNEGLTCKVCSNSVHLRCLQDGCVPSGIHGDTFYIFTCKDCSDTEKEHFLREKLSWLKVLILVLYNLQTGSPGLAKKGFFHWNNHVASFINKNWEILFQRDTKKKKNWKGTVAGTLSHFSSYIFKSGSSVINEQAWWALSYPKLTPNVISNIYTSFTLEKQKAKVQKLEFCEAELFQRVLNEHVKDKDLLTSFSYIQPVNLDNEEDAEEQALSSTKKRGGLKNFKQKRLLPTIQSISKRLKITNTDSNLANLSDLDDLASMETDETKQIKFDDNQEQQEPNKSENEAVTIEEHMYYFYTAIRHFFSSSTEQVSEMTSTYSYRQFNAL